MSDGIMCCPGVFLWSVVFIKVGFSFMCCPGVFLWSGVRQGGVLSPVLFAVYVDDIIERLNYTKLG